MSEMEYIGEGSEHGVDSRRQWYSHCQGYTYIDVS